MTGVQTCALPICANEVYIIDSDVHGEVLVPAIKQCIENVDVENGKMQIRLLEGLIG